MLETASDAISAIFKSRAASIFFAAALCFAATGAQAGLTISNAATSNVTCTANSCTLVRGAGTAVLNVSQLETMLASSSVYVYGKVSIIVAAEITWASANTLSLQADRLAIKKSIAVSGPGGLSLLVGDFTFARNANVTFLTTSSNLEVGSDRTPYTLVNSIQSLASAIAANVDGNYALANGYDAKGDGVYSTAPVSIFGGSFLGLNNSISHLTIRDRAAGDRVGLFGTYSVSQNSQNLISWVNLVSTHVSGGNNSEVGAIAGWSDGGLQHDTVEGDISVGKSTTGSSQNALAGGIAGTNIGGISDTHSSGSVSGGANAIVGGIVGQNARLGEFVGALVNAYSIATVSLQAASCAEQCIGNPTNSAGGVIGVNDGFVGACYAMGAVTADGGPANVGGLVGLNVSNEYNGVEQCYSTGAVSGGAGSSVGAAIGFDQASGDSEYVYWDTSTSGIVDAARGAGNICNDQGITGMTTAQLQSGLPTGFYEYSWAEKTGVNGGLPYLIVIPPK